MTVTSHVYPSGAVDGQGHVLIARSLTLSCHAVIWCWANDAVLAHHEVSCVGAPLFKLDHGGDAPDGMSRSIWKQATDCTAGSRWNTTWDLQALQCYPANGSSLVQGSTRSQMEGGAAKLHICRALDQ